MRALLAVLVLLGAGCLEGGSGTPPAQNATPVATRTLAQEAFSGIHEPLREVVGDTPAWEALWARHVDIMSDPPAAPEVDFTKERVIAVGLGDKSDTCWQIRVAGADRIGEALVVEVVTVDAHGPDVACGAAITQPIHFVAVEDRTSIATFVERTEAGGGGAAPTATTPAPTQPGPYNDTVRSLDAGGQSGAAPGTRKLLRTEAEWVAFWESHASLQLPPPERPSVDFTREVVAAVVLEDKPNGCWAVRIDRATSYPEREATVLSVVTYAPPPGAMCTAVVSRPYHFAGIGDRGYGFEFEESSATGPPPSE